jgi:dihydroorotase
MPWAVLRAALLTLIAVALGFGQSYDLLLKGGHVIDPANEIDGVMDVAVSENKVARVATDIPPEQAKKTIDVSGYYVTPGLVDIHTHVFGYAGWIWPDDTHLTQGTTTVVDCGGAGWRTFDEFKETVIDRTKTRVFAFINIVGKGMVGSRAENDVSDMDAAKTAEKMKQYPELIVGIKTAHFARKGYLPLERAVEAGEMTGKPVIVDMQVLSHQARDTRTKLLEILRPGDIHTHMHSDRQLELVNRATRKVQPWMWEARKRGVLFDVGHGAGALIFPMAADSMKDGFPPDTLSSDLHRRSILRTKPAMPNVISKFMYLGMSLQEAIEKSTVRPAQVIGKFPEVGTLGEGKTADIGVLELRRGVFGLNDTRLMRMVSTRKLEAVLTVRNGELVYDQHGLAFPEWQTAGKYNRIP